jgi:hypothetical protein
MELYTYVEMVLIQSLLPALLLFCEFRNRFLYKKYNGQSKNHAAELRSYHNITTHYTPVFSLTLAQVGHEPSALTESRTLTSLYVRPILDTLHRMNPKTPFAQEGEQNGVFDTSSGQTLYFFIDLKTAADETWPAVLAALEPLRSGKWLTTWDGKERFNRPVTVIGTGNTQLSQVQNYLPRDMFYDAPLAKLNSAEYANLTPNEAPIASTDFVASVGQVKRRELSESQLATLRGQIDVAYGKGIKARYWNQPAYPIGTRNAVWRTLWDEGADLLNADDLKGASEFWEASG